MKPWLLSLLLLGAIACSAPKPELAPPPVQAPAPALVVTTPKPVALTSRAFDESLLRGREFLLEAVGPVPPVVRDPGVGALNGDKVLVAAVTKFFTDAAAGELDPAALVPRWADWLQNWARSMKADLAGVRVRVGTALPDNPEGTLVPVRLSGAKQYSGWVFLVFEGEWLVSDVQVAETPKATLDPESPAQAVSNPILR